MILFYISNVETQVVFSAKNDIKILQNNLGLNDVPKCWALDMVLLIDQSGSMFDSNITNGSPSDPSAYRYKAADEVLSQLINNRLDTCPEAIHRMGIIIFGNDATIRMPLSRIDINPQDNREVWAKQYRDVIANINPGVSEGATNPLKAFDIANKMLQGAETLKEPQNYATRRQVVVLITDGQPTSTSNVQWSVEDLRAYMCKMTQSLDDRAWSDKKIWVMALNGGGPYLNIPAGCITTIGDRTLRADFSYIAKKHGGQLKELPYNQQLIPAFLHDIVDSEFGLLGKVVVCGSPFYVDPYWQEMILRFSRDEQVKGAINIYKKQDNSEKNVIQINKTGIKELVAGQQGNMQLKRHEMSPSGGHEEFVIQYPRAGTWVFDIDGLGTEECKRRLEARQIKIEAIPNIVRPGKFSVLPQVANAPYFDAKQPLSLDVQLRTDKGAVLVSEPNYPIEISMVYTLPSGKTILDGTALKIGPLTKAIGVDGLWSSGVESILTPETGEYQYAMIGTSQTGDRQSKLNLFTQSGVFKVVKLNRISFDLDNVMTNTTALPCNDIVNRQSVPKLIPVVVRLTDESKQATDVQTVITSDATRAFSATLTNARGQILASTWLLPSPQSKGVFNGELADTKYEGCQQVGVPETNIISVAFAGKVDENTYAMAEQKRNANLLRVRSEGVIAVLKAPTQTNLTLPIHTGVCSDLFQGLNGLTPIILKFGLTDINNQPIDPANIAGKDVTQLYRFQLRGPEANQVEEMKVVVEEDSKLGKILTVSGGYSLTGEGGYRVVVTPREDAFKTGFIAEKTLPVLQVNREDAFLNRTSTCYTGMGISGGLIALLIALLIASLIMRPATGSLQFYMMNSSMPDMDSLAIDSTSIGLGFLGKFTYKSNVLKNAGISKIVVGRGEKPDPNDSERIGKQSIKVAVYTPESKSADLTETLYKDEDGASTGNIRVEYR
jgi:uncharacterized protein YegL